LLATFLASLHSRVSEKSIQEGGAHCPISLTPQVFVEREDGWAKVVSKQKISRVSAEEKVSTQRASNTQTLKGVQKKAGGQLLANLRKRAAVIQKSLVSPPDIILSKRGKEGTNW